MKKLRNLFAFQLALILMLLPLSVSAETPTLSGPSAVCAGESVTLSFAVDGAGIAGFEGTFECDSPLLTLNSVAFKLSSNWSTSFAPSSGRFVAFDTTAGKALLKGKILLLSASFTANASLTADEEVTVTVKDLRFSKKQGNEFVEERAEEVSWTIRVTPAEPGPREESEPGRAPDSKGQSFPWYLPATCVGGLLLGGITLFGKKKEEE